ncbi:hypothetical protein SERLA73DRAFT_48373 [Serpula lacrymans var. lacrymans S7.3]|uniref:Virilizer N-terminal domain-containing protein n=1 Tax=Serpula lacrymans var. lacrymans (strain S7.3) TaxID=936435 RepID=F8PPQ5_SERL3|nr:hypothetical protein SERLA73DRAFT_48373 [Serpula lacrymans var. lacrymans S7.3]
MRLLHWCTLEPAGPSNLAAIRFSSPSRVQSIRIFPTNAIPFSQCPEVIARTEPDSFFLDVYFNAHPTQSATQPDAKQKQKAPNALVPTIIPYSGGQVDFAVNMGDDFATRLMIVSGNFESVSMAIYGEVLLERSPSPVLYQPRNISAADSLPATYGLDPSSALDPTLVANQLLELIPNAPPLSLVIRLMFCLKPSNDDWELPEFPHLYSDLDEEELDIDLESAFRCMSRPVADDSQLDFLQRFVDKVAEAIGPKDDSQSYFMAGILCRSASQHPSLAQLLMENLDLEQVFDTSNMDKVTILRLWDASANSDIAKHLNTDWFLNLLENIQSSPITDRETKEAVQKLADRIHGWHAFEDALSNPQTNYNEAASLMKEVGLEEQSFGIWLESVTTHQGLVTKLQDNLVLPLGQSHPPVLLHSYSTAVSHDDFISFVRAYIGVSCVLAVYAWSDSLPNDQCRERTLGVLRLWQEIDGYREIVNHLLLLRQMTFRLECMTADNDPPTRSGIHAEQILLNLAKNPRSFLRDDFVKCVLSLRQPLSYINEDQRLSIRSAALIADDGLSAAIDILIRTNSVSWDANQIRIFRVALSVIGNHLENEEIGDWGVLESVWTEETHGIANYLVDILVNVSKELTRHLALTQPPPVMHEIIHQLFRLSNDLFALITHFGPISTITSRFLRSLTVAVSDIFVCTDSADISFSQTSSACIAAQETRQGCIDLVRGFTELIPSADLCKNGSTLMLRTLLEQGLRPHNQDPARHVLQVFCLIGHIMPLSPDDATDVTPSSWLMVNIPSVLVELGAFFRALDVESKAHMVKRLVNLDQGVIGIGEWLLQEEFGIGEWLLQEEFTCVAGFMQSLDTTVTDSHHSIAQHQVLLILRLTSDLITPSSQVSTWAITTLCTSPELSHLLAVCMVSLLNSNLYSSHQAHIAQNLAPHSASAECSLRIAVVLTLFRGIRLHELGCDILESALVVLRSLDGEKINFEELQWEVGCATSAIACSSDHLSSLDTKAADAMVLTLSWLLENASIGTSGLFGISVAEWGTLCLGIEDKVSPDNAPLLNALREKISPRVKSPVLTSFIPESLEISLQTIGILLEPPVPTPSTPKRKSPSQDVLGLVALSPPTALLRSPAITGLTKTYLNNDFRQLRQLPSARQNTSRLPSMHVDVGINYETA